MFTRPKQKIIDVLLPFTTGPISMTTTVERLATNQRRRFESGRARSVCSNRAATQLEQRRTEQESGSAKNLKKAQISSILVQGRTHQKCPYFPDKEEVPGSSPGRPTLINTQFAGIPTWTAGGNQAPNATKPLYSTS